MGRELEAFSPLNVRGETDEDIWVCGNNTPHVSRLLVGCFILLKYFSFDATII